MINEGYFSTSNNMFCLKSKRLKMSSFHFRRSTTVVTCSIHGHVIAHLSQDTVSYIWSSFGYGVVGMVTV